MNMFLQGMLFAFGIYTAVLILIVVIRVFDLIKDKIGKYELS